MTDKEEVSSCFEPLEDSHATIVKHRCWRILGTVSVTWTFRCIASWCIALENARNRWIGARTLRRNFYLYGRVVVALCLFMQRVESSYRMSKGMKLDTAIQTSTK